MAENTEEEHLDNSPIPLSENLSDQNNSTNDTDTITTNLEIETMEGHKHPHHVTQKKWGEYLLEFLMLFLAVFLGFIAENIRESSVERKEEKEYIHSMINDLKTDTSKLSEVIAGYQQIILKQDTLLGTFSSLNNGFKGKFYWNIFGGVTGYPDFIYTDATIQQLKNSGGFRILRNRKDIDSIMVYDGIVKKALINEASLSKDFELMKNLTSETFNFQNLFEQMQQGKSLEKLETEKFDFLFTHDKNTLSKYYNHLWFYYNLCKLIMNDMKGVKIGAIRLISYLEREYDLQ